MPSAKSEADCKAVSPVTRQRVWEQDLTWLAFVDVLYRYCTHCTPMRNNTRDCTRETKLQCSNYIKFPRSDPGEPGKSEDGDKAHAGEASKRHHQTRKLRSKHLCALSVIDHMHINVITGAGLLASRHQPVAKQYSIISRNAQLQKMSVKLHAVHPSLESYRQTSAELSSHLGCQGAASSSPKILITYLSESWFIVSKSLMENIWKMKNETANGNKTPTLQHFWGPVCTLCRARHKTGRGFSRRIKIIKFASPFFLIVKSWHKTNQNEPAAPYSRATSGYLHFGAQPAILADCGVESDFAPSEAWSNSGNSVRSTAVHNQESWTGVVTLVSL